MSNSIRSNPGAQQAPGFNGRFVVDTWRGKLRIRKWPRKRGPPKSFKVRRQNTWFKDANRLLRHAEGTQMAAAIAMTKGTGLYPRDLLIKAMSGPLYTLYRADGTVMTQRKAFVEDVMFQGLIIRPASTVTVGTGAFNPVPWPSPVLDTAGLYQPGDPSNILIPPGVEVISLAMGYEQNSTAGGVIAVQFRLNGGQPLGYVHNDHQARGGGLCSTGAVVVSPGDTIQSRVFMELTGSLNGSGATWLSATILQVQ